MLVTLPRDKFHETCHSVTYLATAKVVARQVARKVGLNSTFGNGSCNLSSKNFGRCKVCYTVKCFVQLVPPQCRQNIARQVARNISQCNSAFNLTRNSTLMLRFLCSSRRSFLNTPPMSEIGPRELFEVGGIFILYSVVFGITTRKNFISSI